MLGLRQAAPVPEPPRREDYATAEDLRHYQRKIAGTVVAVSVATTIATSIALTLLRRRRR
jgi:hypothetical protein